MTTTRRIATSFMQGCRYQAQPLNSFIFMFCLLSVAPTAAAQQPPEVGRSAAPWANENPGISSAGGIASLLGLDLHHLKPGQWRDLRRAHLNALESDVEEEWQTAVHNVAYLAIFYANEAQLQAAAHPLWHRYIHDSKDANRIMSLAALVSLGHRDTMARLAQHVQTETSPRVRRLAQSALARFYQVRTPSEIRIDGSTNPTVAGPAD